MQLEHRPTAICAGADSLALFLIDDRNSRRLYSPRGYKYHWD